MLVFGQEAYISSAMPFLYQSRKSKLLNEYTELAEKGEYAKAVEVSKKLEPLRTALVRVTPPGKRYATHKFWCQQLGMAGGDGRVSLPYMGLTGAEKEAIQEAVRNSGLI
jgi:4-hydroxy-tetrahydrodipicolinate synthase